MPSESRRSATAQPHTDPRTSRRASSRGRCAAACLGAFRSSFDGKLPQRTLDSNNVGFAAATRLLGDELAFSTVVCWGNLFARQRGQSKLDVTVCSAGKRVLAGQSIACAFSSRGFWLLEPLSGTRAELPSTASVWLTTHPLMANVHSKPTRECLALPQLPVSASHHIASHQCSCAKQWRQRSSLD